MMDDMTQMIKEKLLEDLISQMSEGHARRLMPAPKEGMGVEVQAGDKKGLEAGLDKAQSVLSKAGDVDDVEGSGGEEDDERRLMELLEDEDDEEGH